MAVEVRGEISSYIYLTLAYVLIIVVIVTIISDPHCCIGKSLPTKERLLYDFLPTMVPPLHCALVVPFANSILPALTCVIKTFNTALS